jgi:hypothetical protein
MINGKITEDMIDDALNYIGTLDAQLSMDVEHRIRGDIATTIGVEISLGLFAKRIDKERRLALRALLLCQRCYFSNLYLPHLRLDPSWHSTSIDHWKSRNITAINKAILLFTADCDDAHMLANIAETAGGAPSGNSVSYVLNRDERFNIGSSISYMAIMVWLLKSGIVSYPWYLENCSVTSVEDIKDLFGTPTNIWNAVNSFDENSQLPLVPRGHIIYINHSHETTYGHWMVSLGRGLAAGCHNNEGGGTNRLYSNKASLDDQFFYGFNKENKKGKPRGIAYTFDPTQIPNRRLV